jgi:glycosyltransferase involved in cell wall biosynthesis
MMFNSASVRRRAERDGVIGVGDGIILGSGNGVDTHRFTPATQDDRRRAREALGLSEDAFVIGFVGRLSKDKGIDDLVHAITIMNREETWLLLVGSYEVADAIDHKTSNVIATDDHIVHVPWTDNTKAIYTAIDVLAFPSYREGLPNVPLEAQACGVPIVGYAATGTIDAVVNGQTGILVPIGDRQALSSALDALLHDPELRKRLGTNARTHVVENFNPADVWKLIEATYRDALRNHASA